MVVFTECFDSKGEFFQLFFWACVIFSCSLIFHKTTAGLSISEFIGFSYVYYFEFISSLVSSFRGFFFYSLYYLSTKPT